MVGDDQSAGMKEAHKFSSTTSNSHDIIDIQRPSIGGGLYIVWASIILGIAIIVSAIIYSNPSIFAGIDFYYLFLLSVVGIYIAVQRFR